MMEYQVDTTNVQPEKAIVAAILHDDSAPEDALYEIKELLSTAGVECIGEVTQRRDEPHTSTYLGSGKIEELARLVKHLDPDVVVIDDALAPRQQRSIEDALQRRVLDRTAVILDIFALHARSAEGKVQVELAQLEYNLSRMRGMWTHLERLGAGGGNSGPGVGTRGPGESQLETDRRLARHRISLLKRRLRSLQNTRKTQRASRQNSVIPKVALAGYTNAGKSTLLNALTGSDVSMANRLFETLDPTTRSYEHDGRKYLITDTVGFIERLPHQLVDAFASTLEETIFADLIVIVADGSIDDELLSRHLKAVNDVLAQIGANDMPVIIALNKIDNLEKDKLQQLQHRYPDAVLISAKSKIGLEELMSKVGEKFADHWCDVNLIIPYSDAGVLSDLYELGAPVIRSDEADGIHISAHLPKRIVGRVESYMTCL